MTYVIGFSYMIKMSLFIGQQRAISLVQGRVQFNVEIFILEINVQQISLAMHQDYAAIALLLFTALPLFSVAAAAFFYVKNNERKTPLKRKDFYR